MDGLSDVRNLLDQVFGVQVDGLDDATYGNQHVITDRGVFSVIIHQ